MLYEPQLNSEELRNLILERARSVMGIDAVRTPSGDQKPGPSAEPALLEVQPPFKPHSNDRYHVNDLLKFHDSNFIQNAYLAILKRGPDTSGFQAFAEGLRSGRLNKIDILARLRYSKEGRSKGVSIEGLFIPAAVRQAYRIPILGYAVHWVVSLLRLPTAQRSASQFEAHEMAQKLQIVDFVNQLSRDLRMINDRQIEHAARESQLSERLTSIEHALNQLNEQSDVRRNDLSELKSQTARQIGELSERLLVSLEESTNRLRNELVGQISNLENSISTAMESERARADQRFGTIDDSLLSAMTEFESIRQTLRDTVSLFDAGQRALDETIQQISLREKAFMGEMEGRINSVRQDLGLTISDEIEFRKRLSSEVLSLGIRLDSAVSGRNSGLFNVSPTPEMDESNMGGLSATFDGFYAALEDRFRGSRSEVSTRLTTYLPFLKESEANSQSVLDLGCGRGEWLELLRAENIPSEGVDSNLQQVLYCKSIDLAVTMQDLLSALEIRESDSTGAVTAFHIIEHLPITKLIRVVDEVLRVLAPGGLVIFETPNPENLQVGSMNFYLDPTHRNPLPPALLSFLLESRGFENVEVLRINPSTASPFEDDSDIANRLNKLLYGPMDYAVIGRKGFDLK